MKLAIEIIKREIAQRELAQKHDHLRKDEVQLELESLNKAVKKLTIPDVIFWQRFDQVKPQGDAEYLVCNTDGIIRVSYFDGINWGYLSTVKENITHWSILPQVPVI